MKMVSGEYPLKRCNDVNYALVGFEVGGHLDTLPCCPFVGGSVFFEALCGTIA